MATSVIRFRGEEYPTVPVNLGGGTGVGATFGEVAHAERLLHKPIDEWSNAEQTRVVLWLSVRRVDHTVLPWDAMSNLPMDAFEIVWQPHPFVPSEDEPERCDDCRKLARDDVHTDQGEPDPTEPAPDRQEA